MYPIGYDNKSIPSIEYIMKNTARFSNHLLDQPGPGRECRAFAWW
jgi:hypothetical protein